MFFDIGLYISLVIFGIGMVYKLTSWFRQNVGMGEKNIPTSRRVYAAVKGILGSVLSGKIFALLKVFVFDVLLQIRVLKDAEDRTVWVMHIFIFVGFMLLLLMHALGSIITSSLFSNYQPTLNPFLFLRNFFGVLVIAGLLLAIVRRAVLMKGNVKTNAMDYYVIVILAVIIISGFLLEGIKMSSYTAYRRMVEDYASATEENELQGLEAFWVEKFGVVSPQVQRPISAESLAQGKELHEISCAGCHSRSKWAFIAYSVGKTTKSIALGMDRAGIQTVLWYIHFLSCFFGLAYLPFSRMFHVFATPVSLLVTAVIDRGRGDLANVATRQMIELAGCSHGGTCRLECPVRRKRQERIEMAPQFDPMLEYVAGRHWKDLGSRHIVG